MRRSEPSGSAASQRMCMCDSCGHVTDRAAMAAAADQTEPRVRRRCVLVNNAGGWNPGAVQGHHLCGSGISGLAVNLGA